MCATGMAMAMASSTQIWAAPSTASSTFLKGAQNLQVDSGEARIQCRKKEIHPEFYSNAKVFCNGEHVLSVGGTQKEYVVDIWSGNHPFFQGNKTALVLDADRVDKFKQRYGSLKRMEEVPILTKKDISFEKKKKPTKKGKK